MRRSVSSVLVSLVLGVTAVAGGATPSGAEVNDETPPLQIVAVDARGGQLSADYLSAGEPVDEVTLEVDGATYRQPAEPLSQFGVRPSVMVVLDNSAGVSNATLRVAMEDLAALAPSEGGIAQLGVVTTGNGAALIGRPSTSFDGASANFGGVRVGGTSSLWDATSIAATSHGSAPNLRRHVVLVVGSTDDASAASFSQVVRTLQDNDTVVHVVGVSGSTADGAALRDLVRSTGGTFQTGSDADFAAIFDRIAATIDGERRVTIDSVPDSSAEFLSIRLTVGDDTVTGGVRPGVFASGATAVTATPVQDGAGSGFFTSDAVKYLIIVFGAVAAGAAVFAVAMLITKRRDNLNYALRYYDESYDAPRFAEEEDATAHATAALLQRAVAVTETIAKERGLLHRVEAKLEGADLPLRPAEALTFYLTGAAAAILGAAVLTRSMMTVLVVLIVAMVLPGFSVDFMAKRRKKKFTAMLPDMLTLLAGTLRAGYSIGQGIEAVSNEIDDPMGKELRRAVTEARLGRPLDEALEGIAQRLDSEDFGWAVMAIRIQREVGGNLAELLMTVADTMVQRERLRRDVAALTAEGRMSAIILGLLPPGLAVVMYVMNPEYISKLFSGMGLYLLVGAVVMMIIGFVWMKKTITIEV
ncbi:MAG: type II secretion system F family protein [Microthrixaceae bacterium]|nr:type II secretion system F family protein [Microthrixaceae bacterium]MCO5313756.1 type II secretion system F family protein [Microthrixaceae bacterium]HPB44575.1 type II secretion system F family protein [Microthrixaceae bacterium]